MSGLQPPPVDVPFADNTGQFHVLNTYCKDTFLSAQLRVQITTPFEFKV